MKKTKSSYSSGSGNKNMDHTMLSFKQDKLQENDFTANFNRKLNCQDQMQSMQYMQNPHKPIFQAKNKKKKERTDNIMAPQGDKSQRVYSWRNFGNVSAFSQKKQQTFQRAGIQYMKKERANFMGQPQEAAMHVDAAQMPPQFGDDPMTAMVNPEMPQQFQEAQELYMLPQQPQELKAQPKQPQQPQESQAQPEQHQQHQYTQQYQQQPVTNNNSQPNIEIKIQINSLSFRNE